MSETTDEKHGTVYKWRGLGPGEATVWAHLRIDRIEKVLGLLHEEPDIQTIADKLYEEATEKKTYTPQPTTPILKKHLAKFWIVTVFGFRNFLNAFFRLDKRPTQDSTTTSRQNDTDNTKDSRC